MKRRLLSLLLAISCLLVLGGKASAAAVTRAGELGQPQGVKATAISTSEILVEWEEVDGADSYEVQCATSTAFSPATTKTTTDADYTFTGLTLGTTYYFRVRALKGGTGYAYSSTVNAYPAPEGPADLEAEVKTGSSITLTWDSVSSITGYSVRRSTDGANFTRVGDVKSGVTTYTDTGLTAGTKYYYRLYTYKTSGDDTADSVEYAEVEIEMIPPTPTNFKATAITNGFRLSWSAVADVSYYTIYRSVYDGAD